MIVSTIAAVLAPLSPTAEATPPEPLPAETLAASVAREVVSHNVERKDGPIDRAITEAKSTGAIGVVLQEVCESQVARIRAENPTWTVHWNSSNRPREACTSVDGSTREDGDVAIWTRGSDAETYTRAFSAQFGGETKALVCVSAVIEIRYRICSVHTYAFDETIRSAQVQDVKVYTREWIETGNAVFVGGDFNANPRQPEMDSIYEFQGSGRFREAATDASGNDCRCGGPTEDSGTRKIDYVFLSRNRVDGARTLQLVATGSDHHLLSAMFRVKVPA